MKRILLLEDDKALNRGISLKLEKEGYEVLSAFSLKEAKALFQKGSIDLVISDITLSDGSGMDFCREVRQKSEVFIIFLTVLCFFKFFLYLFVLLSCLIFVFFR